LRFVFAGRVEPEKGLYEFLQTLPEAFLKDAHLTIIGRGTQLSCCQEYVSRMQYTERVHFVGHLDHTEALKEIGKAHVLVQPSRVLETYGLTLIEALAQGTNILASSYGALPEIVHDAGVGHVYDVDNPASLAKSLERIRRGHEEGSLNRFDIASFLQERSEGRYVERLIQLYEDATAARSVHASGTRPSLREEPPQAA
jgi:glycosyltransferase involved in cell wall biosynthesis